MKKRHWIQLHILDTLEDAGEMHVDDIFASKPDVKKSTRDYHVRQLTERGEIERVQNGIYRKPAATDPQTRLSKARKKFSSDARSAENNEQTINTLLNTYDEVLAIFQVWVLQNIASEKIDFEKQLLFIENFKWLTMIGDKLMKRWALVHVGYDTNTRQAQEDTKAKIEAKQKEAIKDAPIEEQVSIIGSFDLETKQLIDNFPTHEDLENLSEKDTEEITV
ncbi:hypothetical protein C6499_22665 [Candidatus Poribacteria bacterium]|nr:MAG: hypothetical protein C6499_22665 [Candidatus Poribacteria bacterium]